ncbi:HDOD domain-containing protein [Aquisalimonas lutea]|uniref:HDOD domain-containing protein n=1 Tax=Aquisalimonas lutea TaxID=1327750 RepID=UPI0025B4641E|nr:HDOD domain-containing protein [Aquisalimonas lutea]MDN3519165.1 HDOD domain-containing protein [Aquisalimonas lutea]
MAELPAEDQLARWAPLNELSAERLRRLREKGEAVSLQRGETLRASGEERRLVYLLQGRLSVASRGGDEDVIEAGGEAAARPVFDGHSRSAVARAETGSVLLRLPRSLFELLLEEQRNAAYGVREVQVGPGGMRLFQRVLMQLHAGELELPVMPRVAQRLRDLDDGEADLDALNGVVRLEPSVAARVVHAANSPAYRRRGSAVTTLRDAVAMLGFVTVKQLALAMSLSAPFEGHGPRVRKRLGNTWRDSVRTSVTAAVIARRARAALDADRCLLAGLMHLVGHIPIVLLAADEGVTDDDELEEALAQVGGMLGREVLEAWGFDEAIAAVPELAGETQRPGSGPADPADAVITARLVCACQQRGDTGAREALRSCTAPGRLGLDLDDPETETRLLEESRTQMKELQQALMNETSGA